MAAYNTTTADYPQQNEIWKDIPGYEGLYQASTLGRIKNFSRNKLLTPNLIKKGYHHVTMHFNGKPKTYKWHRVIATTFLQRHYDKPQINHINGIKTDNRIDNLEWCNHSYNQIHAYENGLNKGKSGDKHPFWNKTRGLSARKKLVLNTNYGIFYDCAKDAADAMGMTYNQLKNRLSGITPNNTGLIYV